MDADRSALVAALRANDDPYTAAIQQADPLALLKTGGKAVLANVAGLPGDVANLLMPRMNEQVGLPGTEEVAKRWLGFGDTGPESVLLALAGILGPSGKARGAKKMIAAGKAAAEAEAAGKTVARASRRVGTTGAYVGAPPGIDSPQKFSALVDQYVSRIDEALDNGVPRGYFYARGTEANRAVTRSPEEMRRLAMVQGVTSSEAPVRTNTGWAIKGVEQNAMGLPVNTGKYPVEASKTTEQILAGGTPHIGTKRHRYAHGLAGDEVGLAPNDRWEIRGMGYTRDVAAPTQHDFMDEVRQRAAERWSARHPDQPPLKPLEAQELNWATVRAREMGIPHAQAASDTIQDAVKAYTFQHSWESRGGLKAKHLNDMPAEESYPFHERVKGVILDPATGKDRLIDSMGGRLQLPAVDGPGVYEGVVSPGTQSRSLVYQTGAGGLDPTSQARVQGTEALRAWMTGQDAYAGHSLLGGSPSGPKANTVAVELGRPLSVGEAKLVDALLQQKFGGAAGVVPTPTGFNVLRFDDNAKFAKGMQAAEPELRGIVGPHKQRAAERGTLYGELDWGGSNATRDMLKALDNPAAPALETLADSPGTRAIAGELARLYEAEKAAGRTPNEKLVNALGVFAKTGVPGLKDLVAKGLAPAIGAGAIGLGASQSQFDQ